MDLSELRRGVYAKAFGTWELWVDRMRSGTERQQSLTYRVPSLYRHKACGIISLQEPDLPLANMPSLDNVSARQVVVSVDLSSFTPERQE